MDEPGRVFLISGQLSAGKSTVAKALLARFPFGFHVDLDGIREMVTSGLASPLEWTDETTRQFSLAMSGAAALARIYSEAGFAVAIEGGIHPDLARGALEAEGLSEHVGVILHPPLEVALERNRNRTHKSFDTSILEGVMRDIDEQLHADASRSGWHVVDNGDESVDVTVDRILLLAR